MKKQIAGLLTGLLVCSAFLTGCGKNEATEAVKESVEDENEGTGDTKDADSKKDTNKSPINRTVIKGMKIQKKVRQLKPRRKILIRWGCCFRKKERISTAVWSVQN